MNGFVFLTVLSFTRGVSQAKEQMVRLDGSDLDSYPDSGFGFAIRIAQIFIEILPEVCLES